MSISLCTVHPQARLANAVRSIQCAGQVDWLEAEIAQRRGVFGIAPHFGNLPVANADPQAAPDSAVRAKCVVAVVDLTAYFSITT